MVDAVGKNFSSTNTAKMAPGAIHDAGVRRFANPFDLAVDGGGGTQANLITAKVAAGVAIDGAKLTSSVDLSGLTFTVGTDAVPAKYAAALAGPAANATVSYPIKPSALKAGALTAPEVIKFYPSGNLPATGDVIAQVTGSKR